KRLSDAERDGDTIYAVIRGIGSSSDGKGNAIYAPSAAGQRKCLLNAYAAAGVTPDTIELVEAHGTGTRVGDTVEITALTEVYTSDARSEIDDLRLKNGREDGPAGNRQSSISNRKSRPWCAIGSVKSQVGHTKAAAGAASLIKAALALYNKVLPPTAKVTRPIEPLRSPDSPFYVNTRMRPWLPRPEHPRRAGLSAFGFGGSNFHAVLEEYRPHKSVPDWDGSVELVTLAADTPEQLLGELEKLEAAVAGWEGEAPAEPPTAFGARQEPRPPKEAAWSSFARRAEASRSSFRPDAAYRLAFAAHRELTDLPKLLAGARARLRSDPAAASWHTPEGAHYGAGPAPGLLAVLFPGQGSQSVGMLRELACLFPEMLDTLADANAAVAAHSRVHTDARRLSDRIYPPTSFDPERQKADDRDLRDTRNAQPAIGALSYGLWKVLRDRFGLAADAFAGHSYGELVALSAAGRFAPSDLFTLSWVRGELMARDREGDRGAMLAVLAPRADIERVIAEQSLNLVVANHNAPKQTVLSGGTAEVERAEKVLAAAGLNSSRLPVAAAFHSPYVSDAAAPFRAALDGVNFAAGQVPVFANTTAAEYPADPAAAKDLLANQLAKPVAFVDQVRAMAAAGVRTFVEVGPGSVLMRLAESILAETPEIKAEAFALDASGGKRPGVLDLGGAVARLVARGYAVRTAAWEEGGQCRPARVARKPGLTVRLSGANYTAPRAKRPPRPALNGQHVPTPAPTTRPNATAARPAAARVPLMSDAANTPHPAEPSSLAQALLMTQQSLLALQRMQEHTAQLHRQFLESQEAAQRTLQALVDQQQALILSGLGAGVTLPAVPVPLQVAEPAPPRPAADTAPVPAPAPVPTPAPAPPRPVAKPGVNRVGETLLAVVAEKTGYPVESLDLKLSLDADLGVDSIKRVEILSALRERLPESPE
ncbi:MAG TPA: acyltransferase domain-containing protein, partial [Gemmataceae bacterium]|nr:acyltransferase domain-containing protein [Gemmataceae bacterium]